MPIARPISAASRVSWSLSSMRPLGYDSREWNEIKQSDFRNLRLSTYSRTSRTSNKRLSKQLRDPDLDINLPYRTLRDGAKTFEYTTENEKGTITPPENGTPDGKSNYELVTFFVNDPENPRNWSKLYKWYCTLVAAFTFAVVAFVSSIITADFRDVAKEFNMSDLLTLATFSVFVLGFGSGPMLFSPLSEVYGRRIIYGISLLFAVLLLIPQALAPSFPILLASRAIDGIVFSAPLTLCGGTIADLWATSERGVPMAAFSAAPFIGLVTGPLAGGYVSDALGWRWLYWTQLIAAGIAYFLITFTVPETYAPTILARRAKHLRRATGMSNHVTEQDLDLRPFSERLGIFLLRPFQLLFGELIVFLISAYVSILFGLLYMFFIAFPVVFRDGKGFTASQTGLTFLPIGLGVLLSAALSPLVNVHYNNLVQRRAPTPPSPELRLLPMLLFSPLIPFGLLLFAFTSSPEASIAGPCIAGFLVGFGFIFLYNAANNYLVDSYQQMAASALAAQTLLRSLWGAGVVLFTRRMYEGVGVTWAGVLLSAVAALTCGVPWAFWVWGEKIRRRSCFAYSGEEEESE